MNINIYYDYLNDLYLFFLFFKYSGYIGSSYIKCKYGKCVNMWDCKCISFWCFIFFVLNYM